MRFFRNYRSKNADRSNGKTVTEGTPVKVEHYGVLENIPLLSPCLPVRLASFEVLLL